MIPLTYQPVRDSAFKLQDVVEEEVGLINFVTSDFQLGVLALADKACAIIDADKKPILQCSISEYLVIDPSGSVRVAPEGAVSLTNSDERFFNFVLNACFADVMVMDSQTKLFKDEVANWLKKKDKNKIIGLEDS